MKRILVTGSTGLVGSRFIELYPDSDLLHYPKEIELDITDSVSINALFSSFDFCVVVHFAAFTNVSEAEKQRNDKRGDCYVVNFEGTKNLVDASKGKGIKFIYISTDMVFSGRPDNKGPYPESSMPVLDSEILNWYGYTKALAESYVRENLPSSAYIVRINNPVRVNFEAKLDYLHKILNLYESGNLYPLFTDQKIGLTFIDDVAVALTKIIQKDVSPGTFHVSSSDVSSPYEIAFYYLSKVFKRSIDLKGIKMSDEDKRRYPQYGGLLCEKSCRTLDLPQRSIKDIVDKLVL
ncbi:MAG: sugar nucleotide-binding protein [Patescibacteria group bacterium]|nr:sugar nucleotide-binding protein [Patescibacteria group bacterium]